MKIRSQLSRKFSIGDAPISSRVPLHEGDKMEERSLSTIGENLALSLKDIGFANPEKLDLRVRRAPIIHKKLPAFKPIPL
ncbi:MAG: hypothetical protein NTW52_14370 [Planctomycetota bacterium]|nr:hypothetical protein [Planctomycetota bacterium]